MSNTSNTAVRDARIKKMGLINVKGVGNIIILFCITLLCGCVYASQCKNAPYDVKLRLKTRTPERYRILVLADKIEECKIDPGGQASFAIPPLPSGCRVLLLGLVPIANYGATSRKAVYLFNEDEVVMTLSIDEIKQLPVDKSGYRILQGL